MAIKNASDLLVYAKTTSPAKQVTRIRVLTATPLLDFQNNTNIIINNVTNASGVVTDGIVDNIASTNTGSNLIASISLNLVNGYGYTDESGSDQTDGDYTYRDFQNGANGIVPTLEITNGTATFEENGVIIEIVTPGSSAIFDPVAFSTSASFSTNMDLRDVTNKDSGGYSESLGGLRSFEVSTDILQSINPDVPLDGTDFFDKLKARSLVDLSFSDRIRNILRTNLTQSGVDGFLLVTATQTNLQTDPFSGSTASKIENTSTSLNRLQYSVSPGRLEDKNVTWTFYAKGVGSNTSISFFTERSGGTSIAPSEVKVLSGTYTTITSPGTASRAVNGLSTSTFTRIEVTYNNFDATGGQPINFMVFAGDDPSSQNVGDAVIVSSWQIELSPSSTDYQDPTDITHWQGNALVSSVSFDAGVEDNLTCSATFTGTGNVYPNGLGPELIGDTGFDLANDGSNPASAYWSVFGASVVENGYGKILFTAGGAISYIQSPASIMTPGDFYLLEYTVSNAATPAGNFHVFNGWEQDGSDAQTELPISVGTHKILIKPGSNFIQLKRSFTTVSTTVWLSSISLKKVL